MMVFPKHARVQRLAAYVRTAETVHLFTNDVTPNDETVASDFVEPPSNFGYAPIKLLKAGWQVALREDGVVHAESMPVKWTFLVPPEQSQAFNVLTIRGQFTLDEQGLIFCVERFDVFDEAKRVWKDDPFYVRRSGDVLEVAAAIDSPAEGQ